MLAKKQTPNLWISKVHRLEVWSKAWGLRSARLDWDSPGPYSYRGPTTLPLKHRPGETHSALPPTQQRRNSTSSWASICIPGAERPSITLWDRLPQLLDCREGLPPTPRSMYSSFLIPVTARGKAAPPRLPASAPVLFSQSCPCPYLPSQQPFWQHSVPSLLKHNTWALRNHSSSWGQISAAS